ncbi:MAG: tRNA pseudouridine(54/55) synthase Pus10 [Candidatus Aenigmarchaeota archaeon]|nr:tRNA pseudouridine(54/55) synthase Pus10 [Candidatus Aenigmarchaeota archaeon]
MKFPAKILEESDNRKKLLEILKLGVCSNCLGRQWGMAGHGMTNAERGEILREYANKLTGSEVKEPENCVLCNNFFKDGINKIADEIVKKVRGIEFATFLIGTVVRGELERKQESMWEKTGIEDVETIKSEINREVGKKIEQLTRKKFNLMNPDVTIVIDMNMNVVRVHIKSLYIYGKYQKFERGIPQTKWICTRCNGKGCTFCKGVGKLYKTSVQEIIETPLLKAAESKNSAFHGAGREDIDARNLGWRPFVIEIVKPLKRKIKLREMERKINKSKKVNVRGLKFVEKNVIRKLKTDRIDKTYIVDVEFKNKIDKKLFKNLKTITKEPIMQQTPLRVRHRRADKMRKRSVKRFSYKIVGNKKMQFKVRAESGLYIKELITGDEGRTQPNASELLENKVKKLSLDVIKIWTGKD